MSNLWHPAPIRSKWILRASERAPEAPRRLQAREVNSTRTYPSRIYLAGPGVFRPNAKAYGQYLKDTCAEHELEGLWPLDNPTEGGLPAEQAASIFQANLAMIDRAQAVIADISPFRGPNMDPGTAFELGYAHAKGLPIFGWTADSRDLRYRTEQSGLGTKGRDHNGWEIEDFGLAENLMIAVPLVGVFDSINKACEAAARLLATRLGLSQPTNR